MQADSGGAQGFGSGWGQTASAIINYAGQRDTNRTNISIADKNTATNVAEAKKNRQFQASQAAIQMGFQERMSNTQHQRQIADLKAAGLNPLLSATSGSSSPMGASGGGAQASAQNTTVENEMSGAIATAMEAKRLQLAIEKQKEEVANLKEAKKNIEADTNKKYMETHVMSKDIPKAEMQNELYRSFVQPLINSAKKIKESYKNNSNIKDTFMRGPN